MDWHDRALDEFVAGKDWDLKDNIADKDYQLELVAARNALR